MPVALKQRAFSLFEVIVASVAFSLVLLGILGVFVAGNNHIMHSRERMTSSELGKSFVDPLQKDVRQDTWDVAGNSLFIPAAGTSYTTYCDSIAGHTPNPACPPVDERTVNKRVFSAQYDVSKVAGTNLRRSTLTVTWQEPPG